jgi:hypothetical protein
LKKLEIAHHACQEIVEVMRQATCQLSNGFHFLGLTERIASIGKLLLGLRLLRDVDTVLDNTNDPAVGVTQRIVEYLS